MENAIRWSHKSTSTEQRFLKVDVVGRSLKLCRLNSAWNSDSRARRDGNVSNVQFETYATYTKTPQFRVFDWSPTNESLVALGQSSGETTVVKIDNDSPESFSLPVRNQRYCNAISFNREGWLATGLDRVRSDFCLHVWDLNHRVSQSSGRAGGGTDRQSHEPLRKLSSSDAIQSVRFFTGQPQTLVCGVKDKAVRIYDLRDGSGNAVIQYGTRCTGMLAIDHCDENYFASCQSGQEAIISIWDCRYSQRALGGSANTGTGSDPSQEAALELRNVLGHGGGDIWNQRFSRTKRGCLGVLSSSGAFKSYYISKEFISEEEKASLEHQMGLDATTSYPEPIYTKRIRDVEFPYHHSIYGRGELERMVSFDFMNATNAYDEPCVIALRGTGNIDLVKMQPPPAPTSMSPRMDIAHGGRFSNGLDFSIRSPINDDSRRIAQILHDIRDEAPVTDPPVAQDDDSIKSNGKAFKSRNLTSREGHEKLRSLGFSGGLSLEQALTLLTMERKRCEEGYLFDTRQNRIITGDDPWIQGLWAMIGRTYTNAAANTLVHQGVDFSYLGVYGIWNNDLGPNPRARKVGQVPKNSDIETLIKSLVDEIGISEHEGCQTQYPSLRQLSLFVLGVMLQSETFEAYTSQLVSQSQHSKAAFLALIQNNIKLALSALRTPTSTQAHRLLAMAIAGAPSTKSQQQPDPEWEATCASIGESLIDPYARAILAYVSRGDWNVVISETSLPLKYRLEVALRWLPDRALSSYLHRTVRDVVKFGDVEGLVLTGLTTSNALDLWQNYIRRGGDLSTAVLGMSYGCAFDDEHGDFRKRYEPWMQTHRYRMNAWNLKIQRCHFDVNSRRFVRVKASVPSPNPLAAKQSVSLVCNYCTHPLAQTNPANSIPPPATFGTASGTTTAVHTPIIGPADRAVDTNTAPVEGQVTQQGIKYTTHNILTGGKDKSTPGTSCPQCGRHMPRCGVCALWLGMPDPISKGVIGRGTVPPVTTGGGSGLLSPSSAQSRALENMGTATLDHATGAMDNLNLEQSNGDLGERAVDDTDDPEDEDEQYFEQMKRFIVFCVECNHGFHAHHASMWFAKHKVCPVAECGCICSR